MVAPRPHDAFVRRDKGGCLDDLIPPMATGYLEAIAQTSAWPTVRDGLLRIWWRS